MATLEPDYTVGVETVVKATTEVTLIDITDAYSVILTSEAYTFIGNTTGAPSGLSCTTQVVAYCGSDLCSKVTIGTVTCPTGISATITNNNTSSPTITFKTTTTVSSACEATIPVTVDDVTVNKKFSFAVAKTGAPSDNLVPFAIDTDGSIYNTTGYIDGYRLRTNGENTAMAGSVATGFMPYSASVESINLNGVVFEYSSSVPLKYIVFYDSSFAKVAYMQRSSGGWSISTSDISAEMTVSNNVTKITPTISDALLSKIAYFRISAEGEGAGMLVTVTKKDGLTSTDVSDYVSSRGENLVTNGTCLLGDNTNFPGFTYDGSDTYYAGGCFKYVGKVGIVTTEEYIPVDVSQKYELSYYIKCDSAEASMYDAIVAYDIDKKEIQAIHTRFIAGSTTTLAQDLKDGDTTVYLTSAAGFNTATTDSWNRGLIFWNYTNSKGYTYEPETYSRKCYYPLWTDGSTAIDKTNHTITLDSAWSNGTVPAGTSLSQSSSGGTFTYLNKYFYCDPADTWIHKTGTVTGVLANQEKIKAFRPGTAFVRIGWLLDLSGSTATSKVVTKLSTITFTQNTSKQDMEDSINEVTARIVEAETQIESNKEQISLRATKTEVSDALESYKAESQAELAVMADQVEISVSETVRQEIKAGDDNLLALYNELRMNYDFTADGQYIGKKDSDTMLRLVNDMMQILVAGVAATTVDKTGLTAEQANITTLHMGEYSLTLNDNDGHLTLT